MSQNDLVDAARFLGFEVYHLRYYTLLYRADDGFKTIANALGPAFRQSLEYSLLIHLRVLLTFFYPPSNRQPGDCDITNLVPGWVAPQTSYTKTEVKAVQIHLNKRLAHFSETRWKESNKHIGMPSYMKCAEHLEELINALQASLSGNVLKSFQARIEWFSDREKSPEAVLSILRPRA